MKKEDFGGLIAVVLLVVYVWLVCIAVKAVYSVSTPGGTEFNAGMAQALSVIGGLVSALVIAVLALTKPGEAAGMQMLPTDSSDPKKAIISILSTTYVFVWIAAGLTAFLVGLYHPDEVPPLTTLGQAWLGLAVSAGYSYFGLKPPNGRDKPPVESEAPVGTSGSSTSGSPAKQVSGEK